MNIEEKKQIHEEPKDLLCVNCKKFFGNEAFLKMCSQCYKKYNIFYIGIRLKSQLRNNNKKRWILLVRLPKRKPLRWSRRKWIRISAISAVGSWDCLEWSVVAVRSFATPTGCPKTMPAGSTTRTKRGWLNK